MEQHLRAYFGYPQDDWTDYLFLAKFAANNQISDTTSMSPFFANMDSTPNMTLSWISAPTSLKKYRPRPHPNDWYLSTRSEMRYPPELCGQPPDPALAFQPGFFFCYII